MYQYWKSWTEDSRKVVTPISGSQAATSPPQCAATSGRSRRATKERSGHRVLLAGDGVEALDLLGAYDVDIVVTDVLMPRMDGRELVRRLRAGGTWTPIIMLTQLDASYERVSALDDGADDYPRATMCLPLTDRISPSGKIWFSVSKPTGGSPCALT